MSILWSLRAEKGLQEWPHVLCTHIKTSNTVCCVHMDYYTQMQTTGIKCLLSLLHRSTLRSPDSISVIFESLFCFIFCAFFLLFSLSAIFRVSNALISLIWDLNYPCLAWRQPCQPHNFVSFPHTFPSSHTPNSNELKVKISKLNLNCLCLNYVHKGTFTSAWHELFLNYKFFMMLCLKRCMALAMFKPRIWRKQLSKEITGSSWFCHNWWQNW